MAAAYCDKKNVNCDAKKEKEKKKDEREPWARDPIHPRRARNWRSINLDTLVILITDGMSLDLYCLGTWVGERDEPEWQDF
ncbi:MAG TPA: hypothetical protein VFW31_17830 [Candidatus Angelobacter sp.]|nr:hypothetical protein [Candidatus Angelobacter sp.]